MNLCEYLTQQIARRPDDPAILPVGHREQPLTYADLHDRISRVAAWLDDHNVEQGDRVAVYMPNCPAYVPLVFGIWHVGAITSPLNTRLGVDDLIFILNDIRPSILFTSTVFDDATDELERNVESLNEVIDVGHDGDFTAFPPADAAPSRAKQMDDDTAVIMHTSGTTGNPKGVVQTHRNIAAQVDSGISLYGLAPDDRALVPMPLFHVGGLHGPTLMTLFSGGSVALMPEWDAEAWLQAIGSVGATYSGLVPTMMVDALDAAADTDYDTSSLAFCYFGGAPAPEPLLNDFRTMFEVNLTNYYGQTENAGVSVTLNPSEELPTGALGKLTPAVEGNVVDLKTDDRVAPGEQGELLLKGDIITPGYWERPERNEALFTNEWLHTEDIVRQDEDGYLYYVDRKDDIIHSGGEKVPPSKVENVIQDMAAVEAVAVFGTDHDRWGEVVSAAVIGEGLTTAAVENFCEGRENLPGYMKPRRIEVFEEFPRTGSQKIDKNALADRFE